METIHLEVGDRIINRYNDCVLQLTIQVNGFSWKCIQLPTGDHNMSWVSVGQIGPAFEKKYCMITPSEQQTWSVCDTKSDNFRTIYNILNDGTI